MNSLVPPLRWQEVDDSLSTPQLLRPAPGQNLGFFEARRYAFEKPDDGWSLSIDDEPLTDVPGHLRQWFWSPRFFAGEVTAELVSADRRTRVVFLLDVAPDPTKIGRDVFGQMIEELWSEDPSLVIGTEPAATRIGDLGEAQNPWLEFARLRRYAPEFLRAANKIRENPRRTLHVRRGSVSLHHVRRVDRRTATALGRSAAAGVILGRDEPTFDTDARLDVPLVEETLDSAPNRAMLALLLALTRRARMLHDRLEGLVRREPESDTRTGLADRWPARKDFLETVIANLKILVRQSPFSETRRAEVTAAGLTAIAADPTYARAWGQGWRALRHGLQSGERNERLWVSPSWEIYERWCFVRLGKTLAASIPEWGWRRTTHRWSGSCDGRQAELRLQPIFRSHSPSSEGLWSVSKEREPDLVLIVREREQVRFVVLDAKYRTSRANVLDAMESAHIYQDSLRIGSQRPVASILLIPRGGGASWLEETAFQAEHRVGVHPMGPEGTAALPVHVRDVLMN